MYLKITLCIIGLLYIIITFSHTVSYVQELFNKHGTDCWWSMSINELLPQHIKEKVIFINLKYFFGGGLAVYSINSFEYLYIIISVWVPK